MAQELTNDRKIIENHSIVGRLLHENIVRLLKILFNMSA